jgi:hypothetical protein
VRLLVIEDEDRLSGILKSKLLLGDRRLEPVAIASGHLLRLRFDFVDAAADAAALPLPEAGNRTPVALQELVECAHVGLFDVVC